MVSFLRQCLACAGSNKTRAKSGIVARSRTGKRHAVNIVPFENTIEITALGIPEGGGAEQVIRQKEAPPRPRRINKRNRGKAGELDAEAVRSACHRFP